jgi:hydrogenase expression/formation protein HypC
MCLAVPGQIVELLQGHPPFSTAVVEFGRVRRTVSTACVPEAGLGDFVMVHAGIAISRVDANEAARVLATLQELDLDETEWNDGDVSIAEAKPR